MIDGLKRNVINGDSRGWLFNKKIVLTTRGKGTEKGEYGETKNKDYQKNLIEFKDLVELSREESKKSLSGDIAEKVGNWLINKHTPLDDERPPTPPLEATESVVSNSVETVVKRLEERTEELIDEAETINIDEQELGEISGVLSVVVGGGDDTRAVDTDKIHSVMLQAKSFLERAERETDITKKQMYKNMGETAILKADQLHMQLGLKPEGKEANDIIDDEIENNDLTRLERFKMWAKENMLGLSAVTITIAGIITTIAVAARGAVKQGAKAVGAFGKMLAKVGKSLGPLLAPLMSLLANVISWGAKGLLWLSQNLFVLVIAATYFAYNYYKKGK